MELTPLNDYKYYCYNEKENFLNGQSTISHKGDKFRNKH